MTATSGGRVSLGGATASQVHSLLDTGCCTLPRQQLSATEPCTAVAATGPPDALHSVAAEWSEQLLWYAVCAGYYGADCSLSINPSTGKPQLLAGTTYQTREKRPWIYVYELPPNLTTWSVIPQGGPAGCIKAHNIMCNRSKLMNSSKAWLLYTCMWVCHGYKGQCLVLLPATLHLTCAQQAELEAAGPTHTQPVLAAPAQQWCSGG
jgi:hypothetical protein